jgi:hypothetical protein
LLEPVLTSRAVLRHLVPGVAHVTQ